MLDLKFKINDLGKSAKTSGDSFKVIVINKRNNKRLTFIFHDNYLNESTGREMLMSRFSDAYAYESTLNINDFYETYYGKISSFEETLNIGRAYKECKKALKDFKRVFNEEELNELNKEWENY